MKILHAVILILLSPNAFSQTIDSIKLDSAIIVADKLIENNPRVFFKNVESLIVWSQGDIIFEKYYNSYNKDSLHQIQSQTKSIISLLLGIAIDKGFIENENELVSDYFPEYFRKDDSVKLTITIRDLLTMSSGVEWEEMIPLDDPRNDNINMFNSGNYLHYSLSKPMETEPFREFKYNSGSPVIVGAIIEKASNMALDKFAEKYLFDPLTINDYYWIKDSTGFCHCGGGLFLKPIDMVKIGAMVLSVGNWNNKQIVSDSWIKKAIQPYFTTSFNNADYGYFWWVRQMMTTKGISTEVISAEGAGGQHLYIFPKYKLLVAFTERNYITPQVSPIFIRESILPILE
jgi:CubicO group peptidase (beta-lactamase class C family)